MEAAAEELQVYLVFPSAAVQVDGKTTRSALHLRRGLEMRHERNFTFPQMQAHLEGERVFLETIGTSLPRSLSDEESKVC